MYEYSSMVRHTRSAPCQSVPLREMRLGMGQNGRHSTDCVSSMNDMVDMVKTCIICHVRWCPIHAASHPLPSIAVSSMMCSTGKNTAKSRLGVIHCWMLLMHSNVPCIFAIPAMKHTARSSGIDWLCMVTRLQMPITIAEVQRSCRLVNLNFILNSIGNHTAIPASVA